MNKRRVVITGMGALACNGTDVPSVWSSVVAGRHGIVPITWFDASQHQTRFAGRVPLDQAQLAGDEPKLARRKDRFVLLALRAAQEAMTMAGLTRESWTDPFRACTIIGSGIGGIQTIEEEHANSLARGHGRVSPMLVPKMIINSVAGDVSIRFATRGPCYSIVTACATGTNCIGAAFHHIRRGQCDIGIAGGSEAAVTPLTVAAFNSMGALSTRNDDPGTASRPFDTDRDGFVMSEGAGILILEELEHAKRRKASILGEIVGYGATGDAHHETKPDPAGSAGVACLRAALHDARCPYDSVGYLNAHGTSTTVNDATETQVIKQVFGDHARRLAVSSTKGSTGHALGAAGALEAIFAVLALRHGTVPPTANLVRPDPACDLNYTPHHARSRTCEYAMSNNLGFGGHNAAVVFKRWGE